MKDSPKAPGADRIYAAGEIEFEKAEKYRAEGIPVHNKVWETLEKVAAVAGVPFTLG